MNAPSIAARAITFRDSTLSLPVRKIVCLGRNYADHAREMKAPVPSTPVLFLKPSTAVIFDGGTVIRPSFSKEMQFEAEMVLAIGRGGSKIPEESARDHVAGYGVGIDMTLRDVQAEAKKAGLPWAVAKGFDTSGPLSTFVLSEEVANPNQLSLTLSVNGEIRQNANTCSMIFPTEQIVSFVSSIFTLEEGDLIFTGTPEGVGTAHPGDLLTASLESVGSVTVKVAG
ncbi:MAG: fumarylacetoacetate hydrolase family protein [Ignavibacteria bacterium]|nr:fumarylacetoacetate hydrolase family protein [Ignavibacteria bacterium]